MSLEETSISIKLDDMFVTLPAFRSMYRHVEYVYPGLVHEGVDKPYISEVEPALSIDKIKEFLLNSKSIEV